MTRATIALAIYSSQSFWAVVPWQQLDAKLRGEFLKMADAALAVIAQTRAAEIAAAEARGYAKATADVVAWLRDQSGAWSMVDVCDNVANAIERGEHTEASDGR